MATKQRVVKAAEAAAENVQETLQGMKEKLTAPDPAVDPVIARLDALSREMQRHHNAMEAQAKLQTASLSAIKTGVDKLVKGMQAVYKLLNPEPAASTPVQPQPAQPAQQPAPAPAPEEQPVKVPMDEPTPDVRLVVTTKKPSLSDDFKKVFKKKE